MKKSTWLHLRIPFSFFLLPVFLFAWATYGDASWSRSLSVFCILHLFLYPASNGYNSYFDKDENSIGGLKNPPKVSRELYIISLIFDVIALIWGWFLSPAFSVMLLVYGLVSKAYSHPIIRLKKYPVTGWLAIGLFQGYFTYLMTIVGLAGGVEPWMSDFWVVQFPALLTTMMLLGSYPMTQVYQHEEDGERGDQTISLRLGILGTFHFTAMAFSLSSAGFVWY
ncbi:MAG: UbiA family prenyltransferase, partial [Bacteroidota bacterium]